MGFNSGFKGLILISISYRQLEPVFFFFRPRVSRNKTKGQAKGNTRYAEIFLYRFKHVPYPIIKWTKTRIHPPVRNVFTNGLLR